MKSRLVCSLGYSCKLFTTRVTRQENTGTSDSSISLENELNDFKPLFLGSDTVQVF